MSGKCSDWRIEFVAIADLLAAVASILRRKNTLLLPVVVITGRPSVVSALLQDDDLLRGKVEALIRCIEFWPILMELVAAVLGHVKASRSVKV